MCERSIGRTLEHQFIDVALVRLTDESDRALSGKPDLRIERRAESMPTAMI